MTNEFIEKMPKIELHVHLEGSVAPSTLLELAKKNSVVLPAKNLDEIHEWYQFSSFDRFIEVYLKISECIKTDDDIEFITKEFLKKQKKQNVLYSEVIFTPYTHYLQKGLGFREQLTALEKARIWGQRTLGINCSFIMDISREVEADVGEITAKWLIDEGSTSVVALGLGGPEIGFPPERHSRAFDMIRGTNIRSYPHAGETEGSSSVWGAIKRLGAHRIGHGVRSWEDGKLIEYLKEKRITIDVCPTSNVCLKVYPSIEDHVLPQLVKAGVRLTINSDDPPMFNTTLVDEYKKISAVFGYSEKEFYSFNKTAIESSFLGSAEKAILDAEFEKQWNPVSIAMKKKFKSSGIVSEKLP